ncbi:hypothetical protein H5410_015655 [Solanum commersonii]|uniref:Uncharacterized protein n=1 Tax=Solanum commersonii TaxID=4109 RepID=A0A9J5ZV64_SOLCO|nr:hypothetical protein H5410_015655 [Solanum commersonii]
MEEVKRDLMKNLDFDIKDDASMASAIILMMIHVLRGEGQDLEDEEEDLETILKLTNNRWKNLPPKTTDKGKTKYNSG